MANKKPIVLYNGVYSQLKEQDNILDKHSQSIALKAESIAKSARVTMSDVAPSEPQEGDLWFDSTELILYTYYYDGESYQWVPSGSAGGNSWVYMNANPPSEPREGELWFDTTIGSLFIYHNDGESSQWIPVVTQPSGMPEMVFANESEVLAGTVMDKAIAPDTLEAKVGETITAVNYLRTTPLLADPVIGIALVATGGGAGTWQRVNEDGNNIVGSAFDFGGIYYNNHPIYGALGEEIIDGQEMIRIPKVYVKTGAAPGGSDQAGNTCYWISPEPKDGYHLHPAFMHNGSEVDQFWWGAYKAGVSGGKLTSLPGTSCRVNAAQATFEAEAEARNVGGVAGFMLTSYHQLCVIQRLALIEMGTPDSQFVIAQGHVSGSAQVNTDHSSELAASWRGLNGLWGNVTQLMVGWQNDLVESVQTVRLWDRLGNRTFVNAGANPNLTAAWRYATTLRTDSGTGFDHSDGFLPSATDATAGNGTLADGYYGNTGLMSYHHGGLWSSGAVAGLFSVNASNAPSNSYTNSGCRLARVI